ncbi:cell division protein FtsK [Micromonospora globispora]|uniref:Cell division protein FtsK n=1 Tax=Micromonospora globispora TaxID=1450148 RepID=A0A317JZU1_9ACTN|nr:FtsK/SpoIIIE domain-containing protein [Micromonospora globispora]PWU46279.1 cell division protein FtsK [Micromonospora globispora]PWU60120.1 cell division protein FtsK [Micromonospora globispora]RQW93053.1 cell division protein FtsK [Micromonospora globispora]
MPLVNVIRGDRVDPAPINVRTPFIRIPLWLALSWWTLKGIARVAVVLVRFWYVTAPAAVFGWLYLRFGWMGPVGLVVLVAVVAAGWGFGHRPSFLRFGWWPVLSRYRRMVYRREWQAAMFTARLAVSFDRHMVLPILKGVRCGAGVDVVTVRMVTGQIPDDFARVSERLAHTFGVRQVKASPGPRTDQVLLTLFRGDPLARLVRPLPVPAVPEFTALPIGRQEDGDGYGLRLFGTQVLVVGATGSGKGSVTWSVVRSLAAGAASGLVQLWGLDPKGGMELGIGAPMFARFACRDYAAMCELIEDAAALARNRARNLHGRTRQHAPTPEEPLIVLVIDELANLTAYLTDRQLKDRIKAALSILLSQGRAVGVHVVAAIQDPRKEVLPFRDLFPTRIGLRLAEAAQVDLVLGDGMRDRGALCDRIPQSLPGVGFVVIDGDPTPMRVRFSYLTDDEIRDMAQTYGRLRVIDGEVLDDAA